MKKQRIRVLMIFFILMLILAPASAVYADFGPISIDGYYDDWDDKPHTQVYKGNNPPPHKINHVSLFRDEANIYVHVIFASQFNHSISSLYIRVTTNLGIGDYQLAEDPSFNLYNSDLEDEKKNETESPVTEDEERSTGGKEDSAERAESFENESTGISDTAYTDVMQESDTETDTDNDAEAETQTETEVAAESVPETETETETERDALGDSDSNVDTEEEADMQGDDYPDPGNEPEERMIPEAGWGYSGIKSFSVRQANVSVGSGFMTLNNGKLIEAELYIPLSTISNQPDGIMDITMEIKKLGKQSVSCVGAGTGYPIGIAITAGIAILSVAGITYKKRSSLNNGKG